MQIQAVLRALGKLPAGHFLHVPYLAVPSGQRQLTPSHVYPGPHFVSHFPFVFFVYPDLHSHCPVITLKTSGSLQSGTHAPSFGTKPSLHTQPVLSAVGIEFK